MFETHHRPRTWGFRFSTTDAVAICVFACAATVLRYGASPAWWLLVIAVAHFFLFCNVFRIHRYRELTWAGLYILNVCVWAWFDRLTWSNILLSQIPVTLALILMDMRAPGYHGIFANRLNRRLDDYLKEVIL
jgi:hypothetical protein